MGGEPRHVPEALKMDESSRINDSFVNGIDSIAGTPAFSKWNNPRCKMADLVTCVDYFVPDHTNARDTEKSNSRMRLPCLPFSIKIPIIVVALKLPS